ncbi:hypothetical protein SN10_10890, partial [Vibrio harveyi]
AQQEEPNSRKAQLKNWAFFVSKFNGSAPINASEHLVASTVFTNSNATFLFKFRLYFLFLEIYFFFLALKQN